MMKKILLSLMLISIEVSIAQSVAKVENYPLKAMTLVVIPFGSEHPITIGTISDSGELNFRLPNNLPSIPKETKENFVEDIATSLFSKCDNNYDILIEPETIKSARGGYISLSSNNNPNNGLLFMVTDENLVPWLEDSYSNSAVTASYFTLLYMFSDFNYQGTCTSTMSFTEKDTFETIYAYDLHLKVGFNFIEYNIESVKEQMVPNGYVENEYNKIAKPSKIMITSSQSMVPNTKWIGKYF